MTLRTWRNCIVWPNQWRQWGLGGLTVLGEAQWGAEREGSSWLPQCVNFPTLWPSHPGQNSEDWTRKSKEAFSSPTVPPVSAPFWSLTLYALGMKRNPTRVKNCFKIGESSVNGLCHHESGMSLFPIRPVLKKKLCIYYLRLCHSVIVLILGPTFFPDHKIKVELLYTLSVSCIQTNQKYKICSFPSRRLKGLHG